MTAELSAIEADQKLGTTGDSDELLRLRRTCDQLKQIMDSLPGLVGYVDLDLTIVYANRLIEDWYRQPRESLVGMAQRGHGVDAIVAGLMADAKGEDGFNASMAMSALASIGSNAKAAAPLFEKRLAEARERLANAETDQQKKSAERTVRNLEGTLRRLTTPPAAPKPPRKKRR